MITIAPTAEQDRDFFATAARDCLTGPEINLPLAAYLWRSAVGFAPLTARQRQERVALALVSLPRASQARGATTDRGAQWPPR